jgi:hypothetical protein
VVDLAFNDQREYKNGNTLVVKTSLIEMECANSLKIVKLRWQTKHFTYVYTKYILYT